MKMSIEEIITHLERQISALKNKSRKMVEKQRKVKSDIDDQLKESMWSAKQTIADALLAEPYASLMLEWGAKHQKNYEDKQREIKQTIYELQTEIQHSRDCITSLNNVVKGHDTLLEALREAKDNNEYGVWKIDIRQYEAKVQEYKERIEERAWTHVFDNKPKEWLQQHVDDSFLIQWWNQFRYPELKPFYALNREDRWSVANYVEHKMVKINLDTMQQYEEMIQQKYVAMEQASVHEKQVEQQYLDYLRIHNVDLDSVKRSREMINTHSKDIDDLLIEKSKVDYFLNSLSESLPNMTLSAVVDRHPELLASHEKWVELANSYGNTIKSIQAQKPQILQKVEPLLAQYKKAERNIDQTRLKLENSLSTIQSKARRLSYGERHKSNVSFTKTDYAQNFNAYDDMLNIDVADIIFGVAAYVAVDNVTDAVMDIHMPDSEISIPDMSMPDISLPEISIPNVEVYVPEISIPEISSYTPSGDSFGSDSSGGGGWGSD